jgi:hypothetical protein
VAESCTICQFSLKAASPETFGYTLVFFVQVVCDDDYDDDNDDDTDLFEYFNALNISIETADISVI